MKIVTTLVLAATGVMAMPALAAPAVKPAAFAMCGVCHKTGAGEKGLGPSLWQIDGRKAGTLPGFTYSPALKASGIVWDKASLTEFIANPKAKVPGNRMAYAGLKNPKDVAAVADYLLSLK